MLMLLLSMPFQMPFISLGLMPVFCPCAQRFALPKNGHRGRLAVCTGGRTACRHTIDASIRANAVRIVRQVNNQEGVR
jgi:hypothetical protein